MADSRSGKWSKYDASRQWRPGDGGVSGSVGGPAQFYQCKGQISAKFDKLLVLKYAGESIALLGGEFFGALHS